MEHSKQPFLKRLLSVRGMGAALTAFAGLIIIYIAFGLINPTVFSGRNIVNLTRSMSKYLIIGIGQSYLLITGNIDLSIGSVVGMSAMISGTLMSGGMHPFAAILVTLVACLLVGVLNGMLVGKFQLPPFIATLGTMFVARGVAYMVNGNRNTNAIASGIGNAIKASGNTGVIGVGFDKSDAIQGLIKDGYLLCTMAQNPDVMGYEGVQAAVKAIAGEDLGHAVTDTGVSVLTKEALQ